MRKLSKAYLRRDQTPLCAHPASVPSVSPSLSIRTRLRALAAEGRKLLDAGFGLTPCERDGAMLVAALFVLGLAAWWLRWLLR